MNISIPATPLRRLRRGGLIAILSSSMLVGCQSPNIFTAKNDAQSASPIETAAATNQPAGLPSPTNAQAVSSSQSLTTTDEHLRLGELELEQGNFAQAQMHFDHVLLEQPNHVKANHRLGVLADKLGQYLRAEGYYRKALEGDPRNAALLSDLGYSYWMQQRYADSERYLLKARKLDPNYEKAVANLGLLYGSTGRREEALAMLAQIGDDAEVRQIMQQIADGRFQPQQSPGQPAPLQQTSVVTTQTTAQHAAQVLPQDMNAATREFVEQMRLAREDLRRAEERLALQQSQSAVAPQQNVVSPVVGQQPPAWAEQAVASRDTGRPGTQYAGVSPFPDPTGEYATQPSQRPDARLAEQIAAIERQEQQPLSQGPIVVGTPNATADAAHSQGWAQEQTPIIQSGLSSAGRVSQSVHPAEHSLRQQHSDVLAGAASVPQYWPARGNHQRQLPSDQPGHPHQVQPQPTGSTFARDSAQGSTTANPSAWSQQFATSLGQPTSSQTGSLGSQDRMNQAQPVQQLSASRARSAQRPIEHAYHTQQSGQRPEIALAGQADATSASLVPPTLGGQQPSPSRATSAHAASAIAQDPGRENSYEQARRAAALMGLGAGPGQVFPYISQTPRSMPGTDSRLNGTQYPAPVRHMPTGLTPPNQNAGFASSAPTDYAPPNNELGQPMPRTPAPVTIPNAGSGAPNPYYQQYQQPGPGAPHQSSTTTPYQDARAQQSAQLNGLINQTWGQSPQSPPYGVTPPQAMSQQRALPAGSAPAVGSQMRQGSESASRAYDASPQPWGTVVVPEPYSSSQAAPVSDQAPSRQAWTQPSPAAAGQPYEGPVIVPAQR